jgi:hypothetical protein
MRDRLAQLLERANVKESLELERELGRVTEELERLEGQMRLMRDKIDFSTIAVEFQPRAEGVVTSAPAPRLPFAWLRDLGLPKLLATHDSKEEP